MLGGVEELRNDQKACVKKGLMFCEQVVGTAQRHGHCLHCGEAGICPKDGIWELSPKKSFIAIAFKCVCLLLGL